MPRKPHLQPIESEFIKLEDGSDIIWNEQHVRDMKDTVVPVICGSCHAKRIILRHDITAQIRNKKVFTGLCRNCRSHKHSPPIAYPGYKENYVRSISQSGYISLVISGLTMEDKKLCREKGMKNINGVSPRVLEHRLVMAKHIGRPLTTDETVHHINGDRKDNRIENLRLYTGRYGKGSDGFYQEYQEALIEIERLKNQLKLLS